MLKMGFEQREKCFQDSADNPAPLLTAAPYRREAQPTDSLKKSTDQQGFLRKTAGTCLIIALCCCTFLDLAGLLVPVVAITTLVFRFLLLAIAFVSGCQARTFYFSDCTNVNWPY